MKYPELRKKSWNALKDFFTTLNLDDIWIFRGQSDYRWGLQTSYKDSFNKQEVFGPENERTLLDTFAAKAPIYLQHQDIPTNKLDWLALMQHHGAPTRLLDWTYSPYIACFFAFSKAKLKDGYCAIYALNTHTLYENAKNKLGVTVDNHYLSTRKIFLGSSIIDKLFENDIKTVVSVRPLTMNKRLNIQQGLFLVPGSIAVGFEENLKEVFPTPTNQEIIKIVIPIKLRAEVLSDLHFMNITQEVLFPDIDGVARSVRDFENWI